MNRAALTLLAASLALLFADHSLLAPNLTAAAHDLGLDMGQRDVKLGGLLSFLGTAMAALGALVAGTVADRLPRVPIYCGAIVLAELACLSVLLVDSWTQLAILRAVTGLGLGASVPVVFSLAADLVPRRRLGFSMGVLWTALGAGIILGVVASGQLGPVYGWRIPFVAVALPNLLLAVLLCVSIREPERRGSTSQTGRHVAKGGARRILASPTNRWLYVEEVFEIAPFAVMATFVPDFLAQEGGLSVQQASWVMAAFGAAAILGKLVGGRIADFGLLRGLWILPAAAAASLVAATPMAWAMLNGPRTPSGGILWIVIALAAAVGLAAPLPKPLHTTLLIARNPYEIRTTALAWHRLAAHAGQAIGPLGVAAAITIWGRRTALEASFASWLVAALCLLPILLRLRRVPTSKVEDLEVSRPAESS